MRDNTAGARCVATVGLGYSGGRVKSGDRVGGLKSVPAGQREMVEYKRALH